MADRYFGIETEYGLTRPRSGPSASGALMQLARRALRHLQAAHGSGIFLENGARLYEDGGEHPEFCTPEVDHPDDLVRYARAGDLLVRDLVNWMRHEGRADLALFRCNVDYLAPGVTWGLHESIACETPSQGLRSALLPFLVSRPVFCGAGGLDPCAAGIQFSLSPRLSLTEPVDSEDSVFRGVMSEMRRPLAAPPLRRLHLRCGESLCSERATWLRAATTVLVVAMAEAGLVPGLVLPASPLQAARAFAGDPGLVRAVPLADGRRHVRALDIQWQYLELAERCAGEPFMPPWADQACRRWRRMLERLEAGWPEVAASLDWAIKLSLFEAHAEVRGFTPDTITRWNSFLAGLSRGLPRRGARPARQILEAGRACSSTRDRWKAGLKRRGLEWDQLQAFVELREELCEIDVRFGQVAPAGLFARLEGDLDHRVCDPESIASARTRPPPRGRAAERGRLVRELAGRCDCAAGWECVTDGRRRLIMPHPSGEGSRWEEGCHPPPDWELGGSLQRMLYHLLAC